ncbi:septation protein A [Verticiella sediminum]|uniref:Inner membrane-spanning protein YciB n=1 Tax=Verticiella sediminum TaxID=1247510 RepID=A0A556AWX7_9BURK|nr:septation protein A [Verticiella sediminum]TSH97453.1 septation protein A [Verticiella sediminum]
MKKLLFDLFPLILFFIAYRFADIYVATGVAMAAGVAQIGWLKAMRRRIEPMHWVNLAIIVIFGGATLWLHNDAFIKWKPTVLYWLFGAVIAVSLVGFKRNVLRSMLGSQVKLPEPVWNRMAWSWAAFFTVAGALNLLVAFSGWFTESQWVTFKVFGLFGLLLVFVLLQSLYLARHMQEDAANDES